MLEFGESELDEPASKVFACFFSVRFTPAITLTLALPSVQSKSRAKAPPLCVEELIFMIEVCFLCSLFVVAFIVQFCCRK